MISTAIGLPTGKDRTPVYDTIQDRLQADGFGVYRPQVRYGDGENISQEYDPATGGLRYSESTLAMLRLLPFNVLFIYGGYYWGDLDATDRNPNPNSLNWPDPAGPTLLRLTQDKLTEAALTGYMRTTHEWLTIQGVKNATIVFDEPAHRLDDGKGGGSGGWSQTEENRVCKFARCAQAGGWIVAVAMPGPSHLAFWRGQGPFPTPDGKPRLSPDIWILNDAHVASKWPADLIAAAKAGTGPALWLYNAPSFVGLAFRMKLLGGSGYLHYSVEPKVIQHPLPDLVNVTSVKLPSGMLKETYVVTAEYAVLKAELLALDKPEPVEPPFPATWQEGYLELRTRLDKAGA